MQKCEPSFGAIPSNADLKKKQDDQADAEEKRDEIIAQIVSKEALERLIKFEMAEPTKADTIKDQLLAKRSHWKLNGPVSDGHIKELIDSTTAKVADSGPICNTRGVALDRRRFGDDSDSDVDLDGL